jgi:hypothetical protein
MAVESGLVKTYNSVTTTADDGSLVYNSDAIRDGLDSILYNLHTGVTLDSIINTISGGTYTDTEDFQNKFMTGTYNEETQVYDQVDGSTQFCVNFLNYLNSVSKELTGDDEKVTYANGSILLAFDTDKKSAIADTLPEAMPAQQVFKLVDENDYVVSTVDDESTWSSAGTHETAVNPDGSGETSLVEEASLAAYASASPSENVEKERRLDFRTDEEKEESKALEAAEEKEPEALEETRNAAEASETFEADESDGTKFRLISEINNSDEEDCNSEHAEQTENAERTENAGQKEYAEQTEIAESVEQADQSKLTETDGHATQTEDTKYADQIEHTEQLPEQNSESNDNNVVIPEATPQEVVVIDSGTEAAETVAVSDNQAVSETVEASNDHVRTESVETSDNQGNTETKEALELGQDDKEMLQADSEENSENKDESPATKESAAENNESDEEADKESDEEDENDEKDENEDSSDTKSEEDTQAKEEQAGSEDSSDDLDQET